MALLISMMVMEMLVLMMIIMMMMMMKSAWQLEFVSFSDKYIDENTEISGGISRPWRIS